MSFPKAEPYVQASEIEIEPNFAFLDLDPGSSQTKPYRNPATNVDPAWRENNKRLAQRPHWFFQNVLFHCACCCLPEHSGASAARHAGVRWRTRFPQRFTHATRAQRNGAAAPRVQIELLQSGFERANSRNGQLLKDVWVKGGWVVR